jgi:hypothetical protein
LAGGVATPHSKPDIWPGRKFHLEAFYLAVSKVLYSNGHGNILSIVVGAASSMPRTDGPVKFVGRSRRRSLASSKKHENECGTCNGLFHHKEDSPLIL